MDLGKVIFLDGHEEEITSVQEKNGCGMVLIFITKSGVYGFNYFIEERIFHANIKHTFFYKLTTSPRGRYFKDFELIESIVIFDRKE